MLDRRAPSGLVRWQEAPRKPMTAARLAAYPAPVILGSGVVLVTRRDKGLSLIRHSAARLWVRWAGLVVPPEARKGCFVRYIGSVWTFNVGAMCEIHHALLLNASNGKLLQAVLAVMPGAIDDEVVEFPNPALTEMPEGWE